MKKTIVFLLLCSTISIGAQDLPVTEFFERVSAAYEEIEDYTADLVITEEEDESVMTAEILYKKPNMLRLDFSDPQDMIITSDGSILSVYVPLYRVVMVQALDSGDNSALDGAGLVGSEGLALLKVNYSFGYLESPEPVPLEVEIEEGESPEMVIQLRLTRRTTQEDYRQLDISIDQNDRIRRIVGITSDYRTIQFDFTDYRINEGILSNRFNLDTQNDANVYYNFLFDPDA